MNIFEEKLTSDFDKAFYKNLCETFSKEELAGMYTLAMKREEGYKAEIEIKDKKLANEFQRNQSFENVRQGLYSSIKEKDKVISRFRQALKTIAYNNCENCKLGCLDEDYENCLNLHMKLAKEALGED